MMVPQRHSRYPRGGDRRRSGRIGVVVLAGFFWATNLAATSLAATTPIASVVDEVDAENGEESDLPTEEESRWRKWVSDLRSSEEPVRRDAAYELEQAGTRGEVTSDAAKLVVPALAKALEDRDHQVRAYAVSALGENRPTRGRRRPRSRRHVRTRLPRTVRVSRRVRVGANRGACVRADPEGARLEVGGRPRVRGSVDGLSRGSTADPRSRGS